MSNVKLAIRVRPFSERELKCEKERIPVVSVLDNNTVTITNLKVNASGAGDSRERVRRYYADYAFDSLDHAADGYASQQEVFETLGRDVLSGMSAGLSACVLAYGQSATGKTYTMTGSETRPGLVPRLCQALFGEHSAEITVSFLEIYNERVHDLLASEELPFCSSLPRRRGNVRKDLRVREHPSRGPYVQNLRRVVVNDAQALLSLVNEGAGRRKTAATKRNSASSRSHSLLELSTPTGTLHLADLAGSEKAGWEGGGGGGRQTEGANINKSLVALSNVISALVSVGSGRGRFVPYRDSALTWLLKDCFTGGARTFIIATLSPSVSCYGESASTLRWAARARQLPEPRATPLPAHPSRGALQAQLNRLILELARDFIRYIPDTGKLLYDENHWNLYPEKQIVKVLPTNENAETEPITMNTKQNNSNAQNSDSTASSVASGSSEAINTLDRNLISEEINKEVNKLFGPSIEIKRSGSDLSLKGASLKNKRRQYKSTEILIGDKSLSTLSLHSNDTQSSRDSNKKRNISKNSTPTAERPNHVPIFYDNQRAEIVASVTERLYNKLKNKEETALVKVESIVDKKIMEPLSELKICTNARQRLIELSQKASRNRRRIGIPAYTQTRKLSVRVRDQAIDVQRDLEPYFIKERSVYTPHQDVATETAMLTPRCKEIAVGPTFGSLFYQDISTLTEVKEVHQQNSFSMTDDPPKSDRHTQTIVAPPRRKKRGSTFTKYIKSDNKITNPDFSASPVISINISQTYPEDTDESIETAAECKPVVVMTPDLLTNHSTGELSGSEKDKETKNIQKEQESQTDVPENQQNDTLDDFPDCDYALPRVIIQSGSSCSNGTEEMKNLILGRNENAFPYNISLSPSHKCDTLRVVRFGDENESPKIAPALVTVKKSLDLETSKLYPSSDMSNTDDGFILYKSSESSRENTSSELSNSELEIKSVELKKHPKRNQLSTTLGYENNYSCVPVYKHNITRYYKSKAKVYREFLGLDQDGLDTKKSYYDINETKTKSQASFRRKKQFFDNAHTCFQPKDTYNDLEWNIMKSCNNLERSIDNYDNYLATVCKQVHDASGLRTPREYLQHLVQIRKDIIKEESEYSNVSTDT